MMERTSRSRGAFRAVAAVLMAGTAAIPAATGAVDAATAADTPSPHHYLVVSAMGTPTIGVASVGRDGALGQVPGAPVSGAAASLATLITPDGRTVYTTHMIPGAINGYHLAPDGTMTRFDAGSLTLGVPITGATMSPDGHWLYVTVASGAEWGGEIRSFSIGADGSLSASAEPAASTDSAIAELAMTPDGKNLVATDYLTDTIAHYAVGAGGRLTRVGAPVPTGSEPVMPVFTPDGRFLYVSNEAGRSVSGFQVSADGTLTPVAGSPFAAPATPHSEAISPDGRYAFVAGSGDDTIATYRIGSSGNLTQVSSVAGPGSVGRVLLTPDGRHLLAIEAIGGLMGDPPLGLPTLPAPGSGTATLPPLVLPGLPPLPLPLSIPIPGLTSKVASYDVGQTGQLVATGSQADTGVFYTDGTTAYLTPDQGPRAAVSIATQSGNSATFSADGSTDPDGQIAEYRWSFGDGTSAVTTSPEVTHRYPASGSRILTVAVVDDEGCSTRLIYDGTAVSCRGGSAAQASIRVSTP